MKTRNTKYDTTIRRYAARGYGAVVIHKLMGGVVSQGLISNRLREIREAKDKNN